METEEVREKLHDKDEKDFQSVNAILRILAIAYFLLQFLFLRSRDLVCLLTTIPIMVIAVRKNKDKTNLLLSIMASAGLVIYFAAMYCLPDSYLNETNGDLTLFGQITIVIWVLSLYTGIFLLPFRDLVIASKENDEKGKKVRIIEYILLGLSAIPATMILGFILWMAVTNYYP